MYYNYRYYFPAQGKWLSRDPIAEFMQTKDSIGESTGIKEYLDEIDDDKYLLTQQNLFRFNNNDPVNTFDILGMYGECCDYLTCFSNCIQRNDPLNDMYWTKSAISKLGLPLPKYFVKNVLVQRVFNMSVSGNKPSLLKAIWNGGKASRWTTLPSTMSVGVGAGGASALRFAGRGAFAAFVAYGNYMFFVEVKCAAACLGNP